MKVIYKALYLLMISFLASCNFDIRDKFTIEKISHLRFEDIELDSLSNSLKSKNNFNWANQNKYTRIIVQFKLHYFISKSKRKINGYKYAGYRGPDEYLKQIYINGDTSFFTRKSKKDFYTFEDVKIEWKNAFQKENGDFRSGTISFIAFKDSLRKHNQKSIYFKLKTSKKKLLYKHNW